MYSYTKEKAIFLTLTQIGESKRVLLPFDQIKSVEEFNDGCIVFLKDGGTHYEVKESFNSILAFINKDSI